jgi:hypothetical protein
MSLLRRSSQPFRATLGFTLIELLAVIAVLGILASILIPTIGGARVAANKAKTRTQFSQWATAFEAFKQEYGNYPQFATNGAQKLVNPPGTATQTTGNHLFHDLLAGTRRDGSALAGALTGNPLPAIAQNPRRIHFVSFTDADFVLAADVTAGFNTNAQLNYIRDAFHNTSIAVITDSNLDGVINARDTTGGYPGVVVSGGTATIRPTTVVTTAQTGGIHAGVIFYCAPPGAVTENDLIMSWK